MGAIGLLSDELGKNLMRLARGERTDFGQLLHDVELSATIDGTKVSCHCYSLKVDPMGRPRVADLVGKLIEAATEFIIPRRYIAKALEQTTRGGSVAPFAALHERAKRLFTDIANSGEGGELLLFVLAERMLRLPQLICKMYLKTNTRMHVHGADGAHAEVDPATGNLALYWGESKIYQDPATAIRECFASLAPMLLETGPDAANRRDLQLLDSAIDLNNPALEAALKRYLDPDGDASNQLEVRGLCLVGFDCDAYTPVAAARRQEEVQQEVVEAILAQLPRWKGNIKTRVAAERVDQFAMHVLCVPFPDAESFRRQMLTALGLTHAAT